MQRSCHILLISGSLRSGSTNSSVLHTALAIELPAVSAALCAGMDRLPHFNPDDDAEDQPEHVAVAALRAQIRASDALLFCTPEYAGALPGALKNLLEWTVGDASTYNKPVGYINASGPAAPTGGADAHESLRKVLGYVGADIVEAACLSIPVSRADVGPNGTIEAAELQRQIAGALRALAEHFHSRET